MTDNTTGGGPRPSTKRAIARASGKGRTVRYEVERFVWLTRLAIAAFDSDLKGVSLPDEEYERRVQQSGLGGLLYVARRMEAQLSELVSAA